MASINQNFTAAPQTEPAPVQQPVPEQQPASVPEQQLAPANSAPAKNPISKKTALIIELSAAFVLIAAAVIWGIILLGNKDGQDSASEGNQTSVSENEDAPANGGAVSAAADIIYSPADFEPYENKDAKIYDNDKNNQFTVLGEQYNTGIILNSGRESYVIYSNSGNYDKFRFTLARIDNTARGDNTIRVFLDGEEQKIIEANVDFMPTEYEYDVNGVKQIKIAIDHSIFSQADYVLLDISFARGEAKAEEKPQKTASADIACVPADKSPYENKDAKILDDDKNTTFTVLRKKYNTGIILNAGRESYVIFDNSEAYEKLSFTLARLDNTARGNNSIRVYLDGEEQKLIEMNSSYMPAEFEYDIKGVRQIKIAMDHSALVGAEYALIDMYFTKNGAEPEINEEEINAPDIALAPVDKLPYENKDAKIFSEDKNNNYTVLRNQYDTGIILNAGKESYIIFDNNEAYEKLSFTLARLDNTARGNNAVRVYLDGEEQKIIEMNSSYMPAEFEYGIKGVRQIKIAMDHSALVGAEYALMDMYFTKNGAEPEKKEEEINAPDIAFAPVDKPPYENSDSKILANDNNSSYTVLLENYNSGIILSAGKTSYVIFDNNEKYEKLSFTLARLDNTARGDNMLRVYIDGREQKDISVSSNYMPTRFEYDISGAEQIKIAMDHSALVGAEYALMDIYFTKNGAVPETAPEEIDVPETAAAPVEKPPYEIVDCKVFYNNPNESVTASGTTYDNGIIFYTKSEPKVIFHNKEGYNKLSFKISKVDGAPDGENRALVYIDGVQQQAISLNGAPFLAEYEYDISGSSQIIILAEHSVLSSGEILVTDIVFSK